MNAPYRIQAPKAPPSVGWHWRADWREGLQPPHETRALWLFVLFMLALGWLVR
jgi:hypothetical protein